MPSTRECFQPKINSMFDRYEKTKDDEFRDLFVDRGKIIKDYDPFKEVAVRDKWLIDNKY